MMRRFPEIILAAFVIVAMVAICGCRIQPSKDIGGVRASLAAADDQAAKISEPLIRADVRRETIQQQTEIVAQSATPVQKPTVEIIAVQAKAQKTDLSEARKVVADTLTAIDAAIARADAAEAKALKLEGKWYVLWGVWIERSLWIIGIGWIVANVLAFAGGIGSPGGWLAMLAKQVRLAMPGMNGASWALNWYTKTRA